MTARFRTMPLIALPVLVAAVVFAAPLSACQGVSMGLITAQNFATAYVLLSATLAVAALVAAVRVRRRGLGFAALWPLGLLALHPLWTLGQGGNCGKEMAGASWIMAGLFGLILGAELVRARRPAESRNRAALAVAVPLLLLAGAVWLLPWELQPLPRQYEYALSIRNHEFADVSKAQAEFREAEGRYAASLAELGMNDPEVWQAGGFHFKATLDGTADAFVLRARPLDWPERGNWDQYLFHSDGRMFTAPDPGNGEFVGLPDPPSNPTHPWVEVHR